MKKKIVKINDKTFLVDLESKQMEEVDGDEETTEESKTEETENTEETTEESKTEETVEEKVDESKLQEATDKVIVNLGLDKLQASIRSIETKLGEKAPTASKKVSDLLDLEVLMNKGVDKMTPREKIVGFYQAMIQSNHTVLKALSEGTAADFLTTSPHYA